jgi:hypothetical protein
VKPFLDPHCSTRVARVFLHTTAMDRLDAILGRGDDAAPRTAGDKGFK